MKVLYARSLAFSLLPTSALVEPEFSVEINELPALLPAAFPGVRGQCFPVVVRASAFLPFARSRGAASDRRLDLDLHQLVVFRCDPLEPLAEPDAVLLLELPLESLLDPDRPIVFNLKLKQHRDLYQPRLHQSSLHDWRPKKSPQIPVQQRLIVLQRRVPIVSAIEVEGRPPRDRLQLRAVFPRAALR